MTKHYKEFAPKDDSGFVKANGIIRTDCEGCQVVEFCKKIVLRSGVVIVPGTNECKDIIGK